MRRSIEIATRIRSCATGGTHAPSAPDRGRDFFGQRCAS